MKMVKTLAAASISASLLASAAAQAADVSNPSTAKTPAFGQIIVDETNRGVVDLTALTIDLDTGESLSVDDGITFRLSAGEFDAIAGGDLDDTGNSDTMAPPTAIGGATDSSFALISGGVGENFVTFRVTDTETDESEVLQLSNVQLDLSDVADGSSVTITVEMSGFVGGVATELFGSPLSSLAVDLQPALSIGDGNGTTTAPTLGSQTLSVATGFTELVATTGVSNVLSDNATFQINVNASAVADTTTTGVPNGIIGAEAVLVTISGPMGGVEDIFDATNVLESSTGTGGDPTGGTTAGEFLVDADNNVAWARNAANLAGGSMNTVNVQIELDGTTVQDISTYDASVTLLADPADAGLPTTGGYTASATTLMVNNIQSFDRDGSTFASNSFGPLNRLSVTDRSGGIGTAGADGAITLTAYATDGSAVTCTGLSIDNLPNNGTVTIQGADVIGACPGAKRIEGIVNSTSILTTNVKTTAEGATATPGLNGAGTGTIAN